MTILREEVWTQYGKCSRILADEEVVEPLQRVLIEDVVRDIKTIYIHNGGDIPLEVNVGALRIDIQPFGIKPLPTLKASTVTVKPVGGASFDMILIPEQLPDSFLTENILNQAGGGKLGFFRLDVDKLQ
jgi:hypothetical protein